MDYTILIDKSNNTGIDDKLVNEVEKVYNVCLPEEVKKIVSLSKDPVFTDGWRTLSTKEILNASEYLGFDFVGTKKIPLIDVFDNNFVTYSVEKACWEYVNIVDEIEYAQAETLVGLI